MAARPAELVNALDELIVHGQSDMLGAFALGPTSGTDYLPLGPVQAMREGTAHRVPLIVGTNAEEGRLFTRWLKLLPTNESMIERLLADIDPAQRERITAAYPGYPDPAACIQLGGDFAFGTAAWQIAEAHSVHAPTYRVPLRLRAAHAELVGAGRHPRHRTSSRCSTSTGQGSARCSPRRRTGGPHGGSATTCKPGGGSSAVPACPAMTGPPTPTPTVRSWCSTAGPGSNTTRTPTVDWRGKASRWRHARHDCRAPQRGSYLAA